MQKKHYKILLREEPEGGFTVFVPSLEGCTTYGKNLEEAKTMAKEAIELYIESLQQDGDPIPDSDNMMQMDLEISHA
mgnify:CR=1 FL=1